MTGKAVISNKIYLSDPGDPSVSWATHLKEQCTHKIPVPFNPNHSKFSKPYKIIKSYSYLGKGIFTVPSGREDLIPEYFEVIDKRVEKPVPHFPEFLYKEGLRESQQAAIKFAVSRGNCLISARPGWGKTFTALAIAAELKQKTLVIVHTVALAEQWIQEICAVYGMDPSQIGTIWEGRVTIGDFITIGIIKTVHNNRMSLTKEFGLVIVDEVHHLPADQFAGFIDVSHAKYKMGMTGTLERKDKKHVLIFDYISTDVFVAPDENVMIPTVDVAKVPIDFDSLTGAYAAKVTELNNDPTFQHVLGSLCATYADLGHKVLFVSDRISMLEALHKRLGDRSVIYHSSMSKVEKENGLRRMRNGEADILLGSLRIFLEGVSENYLSCLVLGASISGPPLDQVIGRVIRQREGKLNPVIVDVLLAGRTMRRHHDDRVKTYEAAEYSVEYFGEGEAA